jgi:hypothetical protein
MTQLQEVDYNYFQWDGILEGIQIVKNRVIKNGFEKKMSRKAIAYLVDLTPQEVENRIKEMKLTRPTRSRTAVSPAN